MNRSITHYAGRQGGEIPMTGQVTLRSFNSVLEFLAMGWRHGTGQDSDSIRLLTIEETESELENAAVSVQYGDRYYGIRMPTLDRPNVPIFIWNCSII